MINKNSKWIWVNNNKGEEDVYVYFRKSLISNEEIKEVELNISACTFYKLYVNGEFIGRGPNPSQPEYQYYDNYIINNIKGKELIIAVECYYLGEIDLVAYKNQGLGAFICEGKVTLVDDVINIYSNESFKSIKSPSHFIDYIKYDNLRISNWSGFKEVYISEAEPKGWKQNGFDDCKWENSVLVENADLCFKNLIPKEIPKLYTKIIRGNNIVEVQKNIGTVEFPENMLKDDNTFAIFHSQTPGSFPSVIIDFEKVVVGYVSIKLKGFKEGNLSLWYGETLDLMRVDTIIMSGEEEIYEPFNRRAFRYIKISVNGCDLPVNVYEVALNLTHYPYTEKGKFISSNLLLNDIYDTSLYTTKIGTQDHFEDCVWREKSLWLGDARVAALVNYWSFNDKEIVKKVIRQFFRIQREDGGIPGVGPQKPLFTNIDYSAYFINMIYEYYFYTLDKNLLKEVMPDLERLINWFEGLEDVDGLIRITKKDGIGCFVDWANLDNRDKVTTLNCLYYDALNSYSLICELFNYKEKEYNIKLKMSILKEAINSKLYDEEKGLYFDCLVGEIPSKMYSQQTNMIAIYTKVAPLDKREYIINKIFSIDGIEKIKGAFLMNFVVDSLFSIGKGNKALSIMEDFWGEMIRRGATTWWETFNPDSPKASIPYCFTKNCPTYLIEYIPISTCHAWGGGPAFILPKFILGIEPLEPGFKKIRFKPGIDFVDSCEGIVPTVYGDIKVKWWKTENGELKYELTTPKEIEVLK